MCGDSVDLIENKPTGSVRISFGFSSTLDDAQYFLRFIYECFLDRAAHTMSSVAETMSSVADTPSVSENVTDNIAISCGHGQRPVNVMKTAADDDADDANGIISENAASMPLPVKTNALSLVKLFIYPVKSCAAVQVN